MEAAFEILQKHHPKDWLLAVEIYELAHGHDEKLANSVLEYLHEMKSQRPNVAHLIDGGIELVDGNLVKG